ncbi:MAG: hypothetical protein R3C02_06470 [Planctomycetaceae bacterium]
MSKELKERPGFVERFLAKPGRWRTRPSACGQVLRGWRRSRGKHYVAMELIDGQSMQDWIDEIGTPDWGCRADHTRSAPKPLSMLTPQHGSSRYQAGQYSATKTGLVKVA